MKKRSLTALAAVLLACTLTACGTPKSSKNYSEVSGDAQKADSPEDALNEAYAAVYTPDSGEVCYKYMYPGLTIQALKEQDMYENSIQNFNTGQKGYIDLIEQQPKIVSIDKKVAFTEEQLASANEFFAAVSAQAGIYTRSSKMTDGRISRILLKICSRSPIPSTRTLLSSQLLTVRSTILHPRAMNDPSLLTKNV